MTDNNRAPQAGGDETPVADKGPWRVNEWREGRDIVLQSDDFTHDVALIVNGDFADRAQKLAYASSLAAQLNVTRPTPAAAAGVPTERFIMDHGMWHDILTGQHLYTEDQHSAALKDLADEAWSALEAAGVPRDGVRSLGESISKLAASPVAPAGVPSDERQAFEAWANEGETEGAAEYLTRRFEEGDYRHSVMQRMWNAWQARAVLSAGAPAVPLKEDSVHLADDESTAVTKQAAVGDRARFTVDAPLEKRKQISKVLTLAQDWRRATLPDSADPPSTQFALRELLREAVYELAGVPYENIDARPAAQCDGRDGVTDSAASSEAREATSASNGPNGHGKDCA